MPGQRQCTDHHKVFEPDDLAPEGTFAIVTHGPWCPYWEHTTPAGDVNDLDDPLVHISSSWSDTEKA